MAFKERHKLFCEDFVSHGNASLAYRTAFAPQSLKNLDSLASQLMRKEEIRLYIATLQQRIRDDYPINVQTLIDKHLQVITTYEKVLELVNKETTTLDEQLKLDKLKAVVKTSDYNRALQEIARLQGLYKDKLDLDVNNSVRVIRVKLPDVTNYSEVKEDNES